MPEMYKDSLDKHVTLMDHLQKYKERIPKFKETGDSRYIYQNEVNRFCFQHDMVYGHFKDLTRRTASNKILRDKRKNIFACLFSVHNTISLSRHEQVCLMRLRFERYFSHHRAFYILFFFFFFLKSRRRRVSRF